MEYLRPPPLRRGEGEASVYNLAPPHPNLLSLGEKRLAATFTQSRHIKARATPAKLLIGVLAAAGLWIALLSAIAFAATAAIDDSESEAFAGGVVRVQLDDNSGELFFDSLVVSGDETNPGHTLPAPPSSLHSLIVLDGEFDAWTD